jgi:hypothetical protein
LFVDVVDQTVYLRAVGKTYVNEFTEYSERTFLRLRPHRENHVEVLQNFIDGDVYICVDPADSDRAVHARQPTGRCDRKLPRLALNNCGRRAFLRRQFHRACADTADGS